MFPFRSIKRLINNYQTQHIMPKDTHTLKEQFDGIFNEDVQRILLSYLIEDPNIFDRCRTVLKDEYFDDKLRRAVRFIITHHDEHQVIPNPVLIKAKTGIEIAKLSDFGETMNENWFLSEIERFCRHRALENIMLESYDLLQKSQYVNVHDRVVEAMKISLTADDFPMIDINDMQLDNIPPRRFIYGHSLIRGMVSCLAGPGGTGKTSIAMAIEMSVASDIALLALDDEDEAHKVHHQGNVVFWNLEDPQDEMRRRIAAETRLRNINPKDLAGRFFSLSGRDVPLCVAKLDKHGNVVRMDLKPIIAKLKSLRAALLTVDPLVNAHGVKENDNDHMNVVIDQFRIIAHEADCAVLGTATLQKGRQVRGWRGRTRRLIPSRGLPGHGDHNHHDSRRSHRTAPGPVATGIIVGPELIMPSEWLPTIWGDEAPEFESSAHAETIIGLIMGRYDEIAAGLNADPEQFEPIFYKWPTGEVIVTDWAAGFLEAVEMSRAAWEPMFSHRLAKLMIEPLVILAEDGEHDCERDPLDRWKEFYASRSDMIPNCVLDIYNFRLGYKARKKPQTPRDRRSRIDDQIVGATKPNSDNPHFMITKSDARYVR